MNCHETRSFLDGYVDRELDLVHATEIEAHLVVCSACSSARDSLESLGRRLKNGGLYHRAPVGLADRVRSQLPRASLTSGKRLPIRRGWTWTALAAAAACAALVVGMLLGRLSRPSEETLVAQEVASAHVRSLMGGHLVDIPTSDQHTVKPWFAGKLDFSPPVPDLAEAGFPLVGGRLDYLANRPVAALVYQRRKHFVNVFAWPSPAARESGELKLVRNGYNLIHWNHGGMSFWVASDVSAADLEELVRHFESY